MRIATNAIAFALVASLSGCTSASHSQEGNELKVSAEPVTQRVHVAEPFKVAVRIWNPTATNQSVKMMSCSWPEQWRTDNPAVQRCTDVECAWNAPTTVTLPPGGAWTNQMDFRVLLPVTGSDC